MQDAELFAFMAIFRELLGVFPKRLDEADLGRLSKAYFTTLRRFSIAELQAGADAWMRRGKFFPKPAEWSDAIPHRVVVDASPVASLSPVDVAEYLDAERRHFEGEPCACRRCVGAGVSHRLPRFVPETDEQGRDLRARIGERTVVRGRWIHGEDLRRWYEARDYFMGLFAQYAQSRTMPAAANDAKEARLLEDGPVIASRAAATDRQAP